MEIKFSHGDAFVVAVSGRLDTVTSIELSNQFKEQKIIEPLVIFDMSELQYISSAGLRLLLAVKKDLAEENKTLEIHHLNNICKEVFKVTGFENILTVK